jgi:hypothetical protein
MSLQTSKYFDGRQFRAGFFSSWSTAGALAINSLLFVGLLTMLYRRWEQFPGYFLLLSAGLLVGSLMVWLRVWKEHQVIRSVVERVGSAPPPELYGEAHGQLLRSAAALLHLSTFYWGMGAFLAVLAIDQATR